MVIRHEVSAGYDIPMLVSAKAEAKKRVARLHEPNFAERVPAAHTGLQSCWDVIEVLGQNSELDSCTRP